MNNAVNEVANLAHLKYRHKAPKKDEVFDHIKELVKAGTLPPEEAAILYAYFLPKGGANKKDLSTEQWVALAVGKKDIREYLNYMYSDGKRLMASDGHRLHVAPDVGLPAGYYDSALNRVAHLDGVSYPDVDRVIPADTDQREYREVTLSSLPVEDSGTKAFKTIYRMPTGQGIQTKYLNEAVGKVERFTYSSGAELGGAIKITHSDGRIAVIMPVRDRGE